MSSSASFPSLRQWLAAEGGGVPFRRFMDAALYDPDFGYYTRRIRTVGARGDFSTSATLSPQLAGAIAAWVQSGVGQGLRHVIEIGPGSGVLHQAMRQALGWRGRWHWHSHLVERSPGLRARQQRTLGRLTRGVQWHQDPAAALAAAGGHALIFSNELVDAFPVTLLQRHGGQWQEVWLELQADGRLVESLRGLPAPATTLNPADFPEGQRVEVHDSYHEWLLTWLPQWRAGTMLTIDYGDTVDQLYHRRPQGTLRGYHQHQALAGLEIYRDPGHCDLTADVNFSDLIHWGEAAGVSTVSLETQAVFLSQYGQVRSGVDLRLQDPLGAGGAFRCLIQRAG
jgi:SAM-dependent MidA family methyltransferase